MRAFRLDNKRAVRGSERHRPRPHPRGAYTRHRVSGPSRCNSPLTSQSGVPWSARRSCDGRWHAVLGLVKVLFSFRERRSSAWRFTPT